METRMLRFSVSLMLQIRTLRYLWPPGSGAPRRWRSTCTSGAVAKTDTDLGVLIRTASTLSGAPRARR